MLNRMLLEAVNDRHWQMHNLKVDATEIVETVNGHIGIARIRTVCPEPGCNSNIVWTYVREPDLWRCAKCHPMPEKGSFVLLVPEGYHCPVCKYLFCVLSEADLWRDCNRFKSQSLGNDDVTRLMILDSEAKPGLPGDA